jgi:AGZA family xanthine/uracil permease-like MFS transporter
MTATLDRFFKISAHGSTPGRELRAGLATFLAMAYILAVNPLILKDAGMDQGAAFTATALSAAFGTAIMALWANWPVAVAPGMGLNAFFAYTVVGGMGYSWQQALGAVFAASIIFVAISVSPLRRWIVNSIPSGLKHGIAAGIGLFLAVLGLQHSGILVANQATIFGFGDMVAMPALLCMLGVLAMAALEARRIPGGIVIAILAVTALGLALGQGEFRGVLGEVPSLTPSLLALDIGDLLTPGLIGVALSFLFVGFFDAAGTLTSVAEMSGRVDERGRIEGVDRALLADSAASAAGALLGTSTVTAYIESGAGIKEGGRTGLSAGVTALLFLAALFLAPLAASIPPYATGAALVFVGCAFVRGLKQLDFDDVKESLPAMLAALCIPLSFSISTGIAVGFAAWAGIRLASLDFASLARNPAACLVAGLSVIWLVFGAGA